MGRTRKTQNASLGSSLLKDKKKLGKKEYTDRHVSDDAPNTKSVTEETSYEEFIATAELSARDFTAEKLNSKFVTLTTVPEDEMQVDSKPSSLSVEERKKLVIPRRPEWSPSMSKEELEDAEKESFLIWRRDMAKLMENKGITPFERNIEVWRQLWRVVERSDVVIQIVDARNPLLFRCEDLETYVEELGKKKVLLINKSDFLSEDQISHWRNYLDSIKLPHAFYSANTFLKKSSAAAAAEKEKILEKNEEDSSGDSGEEDEKEEKMEKEEEKDENLAKSILNRDQLVEFLRSFKNPDAPESEIINIGLIGYPNVGKSSTINSLLEEKHASVSSTPGKTKHFQTLFLEKDILLCDCPGLVLPVFGGSKAEMVLGGILPIDNLTDYTQATTLLAKRFSSQIFRLKYGIILPEEFTAEDALNEYAAMRGFMTARGIPDTSRASRLILKDYVNGKLCFCLSPPTVPQSLFDQSANLLFISESKRNNPKLLNAVPKVKPNIENSLDQQFFAPSFSGAHFKGRQMIASGINDSSSSSLSDKPWRMHNNKNKKEKLRRVYRHLDV